MANRFRVLRVLVASLLLPLLSGGVAAEKADPYPGSYRVKGLTTDVRSGDTRRIEGIVVLSLGGKEGYYDAKSELETKYPSEGGAVDAHVIGTGTARPSGASVVGTAETQLVLGAVPGLEAEFAFAPRTVGPRLLSTFNARFREDGTLVIEIENRGEAGEDYSPTKTKLFGTRIVEKGADVSQEE